ncbi:DUF192 domain-containing protein [Patescibacteria group bacterium]|nr:DUF192 domain-containing protein [Patescibacteria group bacterium]
MLNFKKLILPGIVVFIFFGFASYFGAKYISKDSDKSINFPKSIIPQTDKKFVIVGERKIVVEVADNPSEWQIGLSEHESLRKDEGMLFIFSKKDTRPSFWMEGMEFDIDIIWINDGKVTQIEQNVPKPKEGTPSSELPLYQPFDVIDYVLEVNSGFVKENGIAVGDEVKLPASSL